MACRLDVVDLIAQVVRAASFSVERRGEHIDEGMAGLVQTVSGHQGLTASQLCDHVIRGLDEALDDDVALVVVRADAGA